jgi:hypothetical protein
MPACCALCNGLEKRADEDARLAFDFTPAELTDAAVNGECDSCTVILEGLRESEKSEWRLDRDVRRVYARCRGSDGNHAETLGLEVYYEDERPKLELEFYSLQNKGESA